MFPVTVTRGSVIQVKGGAVHHDDVIGKPYGSKVPRSMSLTKSFTLCHMLKGVHFERARLGDGATPYT